MQVSTKLMATKVAILAIVLILNLVSTDSYARDRHNGFDFTGALIPADEILPGGPPRDGIPAIDKPRFVSAAAAENAESYPLIETDQVLGLHYEGETKAYPIRILNYHEIVNDHFNDKPVLISFCPLCGTGMAFDRKLGNDTYSFGVSGLLYNSDVLMYDRKTDSLWSQIEMKAVTGEQKGKELNALPVEHTTWADWKSRHPETLVLSFETGFTRDYQRTPYTGYNQSKRLYFPVSYRDKRYHPKEVVLGIEVDGQKKAYPFIELAKASSPMTERLNGLEYTLHFDSVERIGRVETKDGTPYPVLSAFWFAWYTFHPDTQVFKALSE